MDFKHKFNRAFNPKFVDRASFVELTGSTDGLKAQYKASRVARLDAMHQPRGEYPIDEIADARIAEETAWEPYGDASVKYRPEMIVRVALPYHVFQDCLGRILVKHRIDNRWLVRVIKKNTAVLMFLSPSEMLPDLGRLSSKLMEKLYESGTGNETRQGKAEDGPFTTRGFRRSGESPHLWCV